MILIMLLQMPTTSTTSEAPDIGRRLSGPVLRKRRSSARAFHDRNFQQIPSLAGEIYGQTIGKRWFNGGFMGLYGIYPVVNVYKAMEMYPLY